MTITGSALSWPFLHRRHDRFQTMRFLGHQEGKSLRRLGSTNRILISMPEFAPEASQPDFAISSASQSFASHDACIGHAELAARHLFLQPFDVGALDK
jgi:hypothetical protein